MESNFEIIADNFSWIKGDDDDPEDLCLHGNVTVRVRSEELSFPCCASAAALRMLRTLSEDHQAGEQGQQMLPCCGFSVFAVNPALDAVYISGCDNGVDYSVRHEDGVVVITTGSGTRYEIPYPAYRSEVLKFADAVEKFYARCTPKLLPKDKIDQNGYIPFWNEWKRRVKSANT